ncbi:MAG: type IX secretion system sortase PorU, partial [Bacteroidetes bacterium]|nr:type IX secretion system sortase PorU [Bacteroidota bacterium]
PEVNNLGSTGNLWVSQRIGYNESFVFNRELKGYVAGSNINLNAVLCNGTIGIIDAYYLIKDDNSSLSVLLNPIGGVTSEFAHINSQAVNLTYQLNPGQTNINLKFSLPSQFNSTSVSGYYDYMEMCYKRAFSSVSGNYLRFSSPDTIGTMEYQISTFTSSAVKLFRIEDYNTIKIINPISFSNGVLRFQDNTLMGVPKDYYAVGDLNYLTPASISQRVTNQNIHGISDGADYVIISPTEFLSAANRLKSIREAPGPGSPNYLKTLVLDINQIYNEFSCGLTDPVAMRNFLKYAYNNWTTRPVYVLFMGDGSYDYKNLLGLSVKNYVPPIERTDPGMDEINSYNSDDFITDINENYDTPNAAKTDFANGRFCINSLNEANYIIDKINQYESNQYNGIWKKKVMYCADDGWTTQQNQGQEGDLHTRQCESVAETFTPPDFEKEKIYEVTYPTVITPQGRRKPGANVDIINGWNEGRLLINWTGHGSTDLWAHEHIFVKDETIPQLHNKGRYPFVTIASCDLARWDDPFLFSAAEVLLYTQDAGAIGVIAATRPVYANFNEAFNDALWQNLTFVKDTLNMPIRIGKALYNVKQQLPLAKVNDNDMKYVLLGDPALRISIPQYFTSIDSINGVTGNDTAIIKALQKVRIAGRVLRSDSTFWNDYNGDIAIKIFDVDRPILMYDFGMPFNFRLDGGTIYKGNAKVNNGYWYLEFIVPKDISYNTGTGKILAYFSNSASEGSGFSNKLKMAGIDINAPIDTTGPVISLFMDSRNFHSGDYVNQNTKIIADFYDLSGINLTGAIGHKIEGILNNDENNKFDLTSYYSTTTGYQNGTLEFPITGLADGNYTFKVKAWDTYNNPGEAIVTFNVKNHQALSVNNVFNYPNPMKDGTAFTFQHNFDVPLTAEIDIYTVAGRKIKVLKRTNIMDKFVSIEWDGKDDDGDYIANGTYIYKVIVKTGDGSFSNVQTGKLAKLK